MIFIAVANVLAITRNYSPKIALRVHLLDAMKTGASSTVANGGPHEDTSWHEYLDKYVWQFVCSDFTHKS